MIYITGDTHGATDIRKLTTRMFPEQKTLTKDDIVCVLGDFAVPWFSFTRLSPDKWTREDKYWLDWYNLKNFTTVFVDGNHDNHPALANFPIVEWNGGKVHKLADSVYHLMRGQVYEIGGKTIFTMGGANSVDKWNRTEGISWWPEEMPSHEEYAEAMDNLEKHDFKVNYVLTHCAPTSFVPLLCGSYSQDTLTQFFEHLITDFGLKFDHWYFGHYHEDKDVHYKYTCLYQNVRKLDTNEIVGKPAFNFSKKFNK